MHPSTTITAETFFRCMISMAFATVVSGGTVTGTPRFTSMIRVSRMSRPTSRWRLISSSPSSPSSTSSSCAASVSTTMAALLAVG